MPTEVRQRKFGRKLEPVTDPLAEADKLMAKHAPRAAPQSAKEKKAREHGNAVSQGLSNDARRREAEELRVHLDVSVRAELETLHPERQAIVLLGLKAEIDRFRKAAETERAALNEKEGNVSPLDAKKRGRLQMLLDKTNAQLVADLQGIVSDSVKRHRGIQANYDRLNAQERKTSIIAFALTVVIFFTVIAFGALLAHGNNLYTFMKYLYKIVDIVWPGANKGTLFMEGSGGDAKPMDEYSFYN